jgi:thiamine transport system ATP-binding protein
MLELREVTFRYPGLAMHFNLTVKRGSFTAIIGPSGGGKSTLLSLIAGFETPLAGTISIAGKDVTHEPPSQRPLSMIFQDNNLFAHLNIFTNVALGISPSLKLDEAQRQAVTDAMMKVGLTGKEKRKPGELSGGERQRAAIARVLVRDRPLLLLDEPFTALGPALRQDMLELLKTLHDERHLTTLMVTHHPEDAKTTTSHVAFLAEGEIKAYRRTKEMFRAKDVPGLDAYLGENAQTH